MKLQAIIFISMMSITTSYAQHADNMSGSFLEQGKPQNTSGAELLNSEFSNSEMTVENKHINFSGLPDLKKNVSVVITNTDGDVVKEGRINKENTSIDIQKLRKGMYFVTLVYKESSRKGFVLHVD